MIVFYGDLWNNGRENHSLHFKWNIFCLAEKRTTGDGKAKVAGESGGHLLIDELDESVVCWFCGSEWICLRKLLSTSFSFSSPCLCLLFEWSPISSSAFSWLLLLFAYSLSFCLSLLLLFSPLFSPAISHPVDELWSHSSNSPILRIDLVSTTVPNEMRIDKITVEFEKDFRDKQLINNNKD